MRFIADFHVHSKYSRATSKNLDLENVYIAAQLKGITVVGTGDCTHPGWFQEISEKLIPAENGLFKLRQDLALACDQHVPLVCRAPVYFMLTAEISNIYKKDDKTRKNHNLVFIADFNDAAHFRCRLQKVGNLSSDGRPILGLDARDLLELLLETSQQSFLIPAHIWTPWFSVLGSKSGFDSIEACFEDLTPHIFAVETGLSSDPPMNWRISSLDRFTLISNSDAHSPLNLGRESNLFDSDISFSAIRDAIESGNPEKFLGTLEFYPEEGKYHFDGHRHCKVCLGPDQTMACKGICPVCGKPLTLGVSYRVEELADRRLGEKPQRHHPYYSLIGLTGILSEIFQVGANTQKVRQAYHGLLTKFGPEFLILRQLDRTQLSHSGLALLDEAIMRVRAGRIRIEPGYDGEFGKISIFDPQERKHLMGQRNLFVMPQCEPVAEESFTSFTQPPPKRADRTLQTPQPIRFQFSTIGDDSNLLSQLNEQQQTAVGHPAGPLIILAGPGTGKTRTLTLRIADYILKKRVAADQILAITFTNKAAQEMRKRLQTLLGSLAKLPLVTTFHAFGYRILNELTDRSGYQILEETDRLALVREAVRLLKQEGMQIVEKPAKLMARIAWAKIHLISPNDVDHADGFYVAYRTYQRLLRIQSLYDYEDLICEVVRIFESAPQICERYRQQFRHVFVDEYQDLNHCQYRLIKALAPSNHPETDICVIGDPDQSIYGFRGSNLSYVRQFLDDYPNARVIRLRRNYRSTETILQASFQVIRNHRLDGQTTCVYSDIHGAKAVHILECENEKTEARTIAREIEALIGGTGFHSVDTGLVSKADLSNARSYADFAVLCRTVAQHQVIADVFAQTGIPYQRVNKANAFSAQGVCEFLSFLRLVAGSQSYLDYERGFLHFDPELAKTGMGKFKTWCYQRRLSLEDALKEAMGFAIPELSKRHQHRLNQFRALLIKIRDATADMSVSQKLLHVVEHADFSRQFQANPVVDDLMNHLWQMAREVDSDMLTFLSTVSLDTDTDLYAKRAEKVSLMTMHAAKGLEFPVVFIAGCEDGFLPYQHPGNGEADLQEERRLFYVAMTRAMDLLYLTFAQKRRIYAKIQNRTISAFVADIDNRLKSVREAEFLEKPKKTQAVQLSLFKSSG